jgi:hypothetical protein
LVLKKTSPDPQNIFCDLDKFFCDLNNIFCDLQNIFCDLQNIFCDLENFFVISTIYFADRETESAIETFNFGGRQFFGRSGGWILAIASFFCGVVGKNLLGWRWGGAIVRLGAANWGGRSLGGGMGHFVGLS